MPWRRYRYGLKFWEVVVLLCVLAALAAVGIGQFLTSFYAYDPQYYDPKEFTREETLGKKQGD